MIVGGKVYGIHGVLRAKTVRTKLCLREEHDTHARSFIQGSMPEAFSSPSHPSNAASGTPSLVRSDN